MSASWYGPEYFTQKYLFCRNLMLFLFQKSQLKFKKYFFSDVSVVLMFQRNVPIEWYKSARFENSDQNDAYEKVRAIFPFFYLLLS